MRVDFGDMKKQIEFFKSLKPKNMKLKVFYEKINSFSIKTFTFPSFRGWYQGRNLSTSECVEAICKFTNYKIANLKIKTKPENWGRVLGGKRKYKLYGLNLTREQRLKAGKNGMASLRKKLGKEGWRRVCFLAGTISAKNNSNFRRKVTGPKGERMFNGLEKEVAEILYELNFDYEYEKILRINDSFLIPDFIIPPKIIIECTYWGFVNDKSKRLEKRFNKILKNTSIDRIVLITNNRLKNKYNQKLGKMVDVITPKELPEWFITQS